MAGKKKRDAVQFEDEGEPVAAVGEDQDVKDERNIIDDPNYTNEVESAIKIVHLRKEFLPKGNESKGTVAVDDFCLRIKPGRKGGG
jgi:hypothetical protein